jgi:hypothetical protein
VRQELMNRFLLYLDVKSAISEITLSRFVDDIPDRLLQTARLYISHLSTQKRPATESGTTGDDRVSEDFMEDYDQNRCPQCNRRL